MMKKETAVLTVIVLVIGILIGVIYSNWRKDSASGPAGVQAPPPSVVNYQQKISMLEEIVTKEPGNRNAWVQLGHNYFDSDQPMKAIDAYQKALDLDDKDADILTDQGVMFRRVGWYDKAIANFKKASELVPNHQQSLYNLGIVYRYDLKDFSAAVSAWEKLLAISPSAPGADQVRRELEFLKNHPNPATPQ
jgi:cytochrome c-type biogenesis protein CcmH/NrfG